MLTKKLLVLLTVVSLTPWTIGCTELECGEGTSEVDGLCEVNGFVSPETVDNCGQDTHYDLTEMACIPDLPPTECDESTTVEVPDPITGVINCIGIGGNDCFGTFLCNPPVSGKVSLCGQLMDVRTNTMIRDLGAQGTLCDPDNPTADGPCSLEIIFYDAVDFAGNPDTAIPLNTGRIQIDDCGRFRGESITFPTSANFVGFAVNDATSGGGDIWARTGVAVEVAPNELIEGFRGYGVLHTTIEEWTSSAGVPYNFWERGIFVPLFMSGEPTIDDGDPGDPALNVHKRLPGVTILSAGSPAAARDFYFSDPDPNQLITVDPGLNVTGVNGAGLMIDSGLVMHSGQGGEPVGCEFESNLADSIPTVAFIQEKIAVSIATGEVCD